MLTDALPRGLGTTHALRCDCPRPNGGIAAAATNAARSPHSHQGSSSAGFRILKYPRSPPPTAFGSSLQPVSAAYGWCQQRWLPPVVSNKRESALPLLTPSGLAFAVGGKVQEISSDPLCPCMMHWPSNEPFPEQGQIRPSWPMGPPRAPILNTGNRGPILHQPGDWICSKCNYLNWRRRKVCLTCFPYAEGNWAAISSGVQAQRVALRTSIITQTRLSPTSATPTSSLSRPQPAPRPAGRSRHVTPAGVACASPSPQHRGRGRGSDQAAHRPPFRKKYNRTQFINHEDQTHHQTAPRQSRPRTLRRHPPTVDHTSVDVLLRSPLLPSFLQDMLRGPMLPPSSTLAAELPLAECDLSLTRWTLSQSGVDPAISAANIWRLDGEDILQGPVSM